MEANANSCVHSFLGSHYRFALSMRWVSRILYVAKDMTRSFHSIDAENVGQIE